MNSGTQHDSKHKAFAAVQTGPRSDGVPVVM